MDLCWVGSDVLYMNKYPKGTRFRFKVKIFVFRIIVHILDRFYITRNWVVSEHLADELKLKTPIMKIEYPRSNPNHYHLVYYPKVRHEGFNVLYYFPKGKKNRVFIEWLYGWDVFQILKQHYGNKINWIIADGTKEMDKVYPYIDFYIRPNRHDGMPMMVRECIANKIPYYWSKTEPDIVAIKKELDKLV